MSEVAAYMVVGIFSKKHAYLGFAVCLTDPTKRGKRSDVRIAVDGKRSWRKRCGMLSKPDESGDSLRCHLPIGLIQEGDSGLFDEFGRLCCGRVCSRQHDAGNGEARHAEADSEVAEGVRLTGHIVERASVLVSLSEGNPDLEEFGSRLSGQRSAESAQCVKALPAVHRRLAVIACP